MSRVEAVWSRGAQKAAGPWSFSGVSRRAGTRTGVPANPVICVQRETVIHPWLRPGPLPCRAVCCRHGPESQRHPPRMQPGRQATG